MTVADVYAEHCAVWSDVVEHLPLFYDTVIDTEAKTVVELGVRSGNSTAAFLAALEQTEGHLWSVDVRLPRVPAAFRESGRWTFIIGDDLAVAHQLPDEIDVLFIDTSHYYEHTLAELRLYGPKSKTILLHDTELERPDGAPPSPLFPVKCAVEQWTTETGRPWRNLTNCYGLGIIGGGVDG